MRAIYRNLFFALFIGFIISSSLNFAQSESKIRNILDEYAEDIFNVYHKASTFNSSAVKTKYVDDYVKATLTINYKGWFKQHRMKLAIKFDEDGPFEVELRSDTNFNKSFKDKKASESLMILQDAWEE